MHFDIQKASVWKRISAHLFDFIVITILAAGFGLLLSTVTGYDSYDKEFTQIYKDYETQYGVSFQTTQEQWEEMTQQEKDRYDEACAALLEDKQAMHAYNMISTLMLVIVSLSILLAYLAWELGIPLWIGNGQTLGKKIFGVALMRSDGVKVTPFMMFVRTVLGKYTVETMIPVLMFMMILSGTIGVVGPMIVLALAAIQLGMSLFSQNRTAIHDYLAHTVAVDMSSQLIFEDEQAMLQYKKELHAQEAARQDYEAGCALRQNDISK